MKNKLILKILDRIGVTRKYVLKCNSNKWVYVSYIPDVFYRKNDKAYLMSHQNKRESLVIAEVLHSLGYNVRVGSYGGGQKIDNKYDIVFGVEPGFIDACVSNPNAIKVYYATGAYAGHQNRMTIERTEEFNRTHNIRYPYERLVNADAKQLFLADRVLQIGSNYTIETYPESIRNRITIIHQSSTLDDLKVDISKKDFSNKKHIMWLGSGGLVLKGLDLVIDAIQMLPEVTLHVVGRMNDAFISAYSSEQLKRVKFHGFQNLASDSFRVIADKCNFMVYPSCSEGMPGSVINTMRFGLIPLVTKWAADDEIEKVGGYIISEMTPECVASSISEALRLEHNEIREKAFACQKYSEQTYNLIRFKNELIQYFSEL